MSDQWDQDYNGDIGFEAQQQKHLHQHQPHPHQQFLNFGDHFQDDAVVAEQNIHNMLEDFLAQDQPNQDHSVHNVHDVHDVHSVHSAHNNHSDVNQEHNGSSEQGSNPHLAHLNSNINPQHLFHSPALDPYDHGTAILADDSMTPLMSPVVTPFLHSRNSTQAAFSPISSPIIDAQNNVSSPYPLLDENNMDSLTGTGQNQNPSVRVRNGGSGSAKSTTPVLAPQGGRVQKFSPLLRGNNPGRRKPSLNSIKQQQQQQQQQAGHDSVMRQSSLSADISPRATSGDSVSPDAMTELQMPPPKSVAKKSSSHISRNNDGTAPATPASLMDLSSAAKIMATKNGTVDEQHLQEALLATNSSRSRSHNSSRNSSATSSPAIAPNLPNIKPRISRRASSHATPQISPVIMPKISSSSTSSLITTAQSGDDLSALLASKSNYQNIVEGNHSHLGLQYPEHLSADIVSKKTNHKLAEQGRRNRINVALTELSTLLPENEDGSSKALTVEMAILYVKHLQKANTTLKEMLPETERGKYEKLEADMLQDLQAELRKNKSKSAG